MAKIMLAATEEARLKVSMKVKNLAASTWKPI